MFIGHYGIALAAKKLAPRTSLGTLFLAANLLDLIWPTLLLLGVESVRIDTSQRGVSPLVFTNYPWTHSLVAVCVWAVLLGAAHFAWARDRRAALVVGGLVISHWLLDAIVHRPDLLLVPGGHWAIGFGLWRSTVATLIVELGLVAFGLLAFLRAGAHTRRGPLWALVAFLVAIYLASVFGPPPPSVAAIAWAGQAQWLIVLAAFWIDPERGAHTHADPVGTRAA
ncbi:MAG: hypothetical protein ACM3PU_16015 [Gemmatimonadota bacterium]